MGDLLRQLQIRKSVADGAGARAFYTDLTTPPGNWVGELRDLVLKKKQVGCLFGHPKIRCRMMLT
jgi:dipeptidyl-peptidase-3